MTNPSAREIERGYGALRFMQSPYGKCGVCAHGLTLLESSEPQRQCWPCRAQNAEAPRGG